MRKGFLNSCLALIAFGLIGCFGFSNKRGFYTYTLPVADSEVGPSLRTNGAYTCSQDHGSVFFLYKDGSCKWAGWSGTCCPWHATDPEEIEKNMTRLSDREHWGHYAVIGDSLVIQEFTRNNNELPPRSIIEHRGVITSDTSFVLSTTYAYGYKDPLQTEREEYHFQQTSSKPDSTLGWFNNRKWFLDSLHASRRPGL